MEIPSEAKGSVLFRVSRLQESQLGLVAWEAAVIDESESQARLAITPLGEVAVGDTALLGSAQRREDGSLTVAVLPGQDPARLVPVSTDACDICGTRRARRHLIIQRDGVQMSVGVSCLERAGVIERGRDAQAFFRAATLDPREELQRTVERFMAKPQQGVLEALAAAIYCTRHYGYTSKKRAARSGDIPTSARMALLLAASEGQTPLEVSDHLLAAAVLRNDLLSRDVPEGNDFLAKAVHMLQRESLREPDLGVIAAIPVVYSHIDDPEPEPWVPGWEGDIGERIAVPASLESTVDILHDDGTCSKKHVFRSREGRCLSWITQAQVDIPPGNIILRGTVKERRVFRHVNETLLSRCRIEFAEG
jgi:hypothetical protein